MDVRIETLKPMHVVSHTQMGPYQLSAPRAWEHLWGWVFTNDLAPRVKTVVGYGLDSPKLIPAHMLRYVACVELQAGPDGKPHAGDKAAQIGRRRLHGGRTGVYRMKGAYTQMPAMFAKLHDEWMCSAGEVPDYSRRYLEIYLNDPSEVGMDNALTDLCLPLRDPVPDPAAP